MTLHAEVRPSFVLTMVLMIVAALFGIGLSRKQSRPASKPGQRIPVQQAQVVRNADRRDPQCPPVIPDDPLAAKQPQPKPTEQPQPVIIESDQPADRPSPFARRGNNPKRDWQQDANEAIASANAEIGAKLADLLGAAAR